MQLALGAVYAWSVFVNPLKDRFGWSQTQVTSIFTLSIFMLGVSAYFGGLWMNRKGPRIGGSPPHRGPTAPSTPSSRWYPRPCPAGVAQW
jgi:hypothetical protein